MFLLAILVGSAATAYAGSPLAMTSFSGPSAGGRYTVDLTPGCSDPNMGTYCTGNTGAYVGPTSLSIELYTHHRAGSECTSKGYAFDPTTLGPGGSFSTKAYFSNGSPQLAFTVSGTFVSASRVHGTVVGNYGCGTSSFTITLHPAPLIATAPCAMVTAVHGMRTIAGGTLAENETRSDSFTPQGGECSMLIGRYEEGFEFIVSSSPAALESGQLAQDGEPYQHHQGVPGLGPGATLYVNNVYTKTVVKKNGQVVQGKPTAAVRNFELDFRRDGVLASISLAAKATGCECFEPSQFAVAKRHLLAVAKNLRPLLH